MDISFLESPTKMDQVETVSPYLAILDNVPFLVPFEDRVRILRHRITIDKEMSVTLQRETVPIRRPFVMEDGFAKLNPLGKTVFFCTLFLYNNCSIANRC